MTIMIVNSLGQGKLIVGKIEPEATHWLVSGIELSAGSGQ